MCIVIYKLFTVYIMATHWSDSSDDDDTQHPIGPYWNHQNKNQFVHKSTTRLSPPATPATPSPKPRAIPVIPSTTHWSDSSDDDDDDNDDDDTQHRIGPSWNHQNKNQSVHKPTTRLSPPATPPPKLRSIQMPDQILLKNQQPGADLTGYVLASIDIPNKLALIIDNKPNQKVQILDADNQEKLISLEDYDNLTNIYNDNQVTYHHKINIVTHLTSPQIIKLLNIVFIRNKNESN